VDRAQLLVVLASERDRFQRLTDAVGAARMDEPLVPGSYSMRDIIAHLSAYEHALVTSLKEAEAGRVSVDTVLDRPDLDARNAAVLEATKHRSAAEVVTTFRETRDQLEACVRLLNDDELTNAEATAWFVEPRWHRRQALWQCIADDTFEHQQEHIPDIERWLAQKGGA
jgi:hypothetical protein